MKERPILFSGPMVRAILDGRKTQTSRIVTDLRVVPRRKVTADPMPGQNVGDLVAVAPPHRYRAGIGRAGAVFAELGDEGNLGLKPGEFDFVCPYADGRTYLDDGRWRIDVAPGQRLWVRETWQYAGWTEDGLPWIRYEADGAKRLCERIPVDWHDRLADTWTALSSDQNVAIDGLAADRRWRSARFIPRWASRLTLDVVAVRVERLQSITEDDARAEGVRATDAAAVFEGGAGRRRDMERTARGAFACLWDSINGDRALWSTDPWVWVVEFRAVRP